MANTQGIPTFDAFRLKGWLAAYPTSGMKVALYTAAATINATTAAYTATGEASGAGYTAGGATVNSGTAPTVSSNTAIWTPAADPAWSTVTLTTVDCAMFYDDNDADGNRGVFTFGSVTVAAANFTLQRPAHASGTALSRCAFS